MHRIVVVAAAVLLLAGCAPEPVASPTASPTPSATPAALVLPTCNTLFTDAQVTELMGDNMQAMGDISPEGATYGSTVPELQSLIAAAPDEFNCSWIIPASERGLTLSIIPADAATRAQVIDALAPATGTVDGSARFFDATTADEMFPFNEANAVGGPGVNLWISVHDSGTRALDITHAAWNSVVALNPGL
ncbi:MAG: hypothetical protein EPN91_09710 [Salinibacterium sp.]|nr:MAG: hypothetical protein EPN91_09710 [Salinibacterium sp.]